METSSTTAIHLRTALQVAIPLWIEQLKGLSWDDLTERAHRAAQIVAEKGDIIQYASTKPGETAKAFNALAEGVAVLSFCPGGVTFLGDHWETKIEASGWVL